MLVIIESTTVRRFSYSTFHINAFLCILFIHTSVMLVHKREKSIVHCFKLRAVKKWDRISFYISMKSVMST